jgi:hypothetical protein
VEELVVEQRETTRDRRVSGWCCQPCLGVADVRQDRILAEEGFFSPQTSWLSAETSAPNIHLGIASMVTHGGACQQAQE